MDLIEWTNEAKVVADEVIRRVAAYSFYSDELTDVRQQLGAASTVEAAALVYTKFTDRFEPGPERSSVHNVILDVVVRLICDEYHCIQSRCDFDTAVKEVFRDRLTQDLHSRIHQSFHKTTANIEAFAPALKPFSPRRNRPAVRAARVRFGVGWDLWLQEDDYLEARLRLRLLKMALGELSTESFACSEPLLSAATAAGGGVRRYSEI